MPPTAVSQFRCLRSLRGWGLAALLLGCGLDKPLAFPGVDGGAALDANGEVSAELDAGDDATGPGTMAATCPPPLSTVCAEPSPSFANDVVPILDARCNSCHDATIPDAPWPLHDRQDVLDWKGIVVDSLLNCTMPPADSGSTLPENERQRLFAWFACDTPDN